MFTALSRRRASAVKPASPDTVVIHPCLRGERVTASKRLPSSIGPLSKLKVHPRTLPGREDPRGSRTRFAFRFRNPRRVERNARFFRELVQPDHTILSNHPEIGTASTSWRRLQPTLFNFQRRTPAPRVATESLGDRSPSAYRSSVSFTAKRPASADQSSPSGFVDPNQLVFRPNL